MIGRKIDSIVVSVLTDIEANAADRAVFFLIANFATGKFIDPGKNWFLVYIWYLSYEHQLARCAGVLGARAANDANGDEAESLHTRSKKLLFLAVSHFITEIKAEQVAAVGEAKFQAAQLAGDSKTTVKYIETCDRLFYACVGPTRPPMNGVSR